MTGTRRTPRTSFFAREVPRLTWVRPVPGRLACGRVTLPGGEAASVVRAPAAGPSFAARLHGAEDWFLLRDGVELGRVERVRPPWQALLADVRAGVDGHTGRGPVRITGRRAWRRRLRGVEMRHADGTSWWFRLRDNVVLLDGAGRPLAVRGPGGWTLPEASLAAEDEAAVGFAVAFHEAAGLADFLVHPVRRFLDHVLMALVSSLSP
ncbi:hypothetical protein C0Q57_21445 [Streptomyces albidoflavus]|uniref:hypothetical protein n=1 Tax=Streptomyces albidoflavus TaxID=1886 RepID=UPI00035C1302|nr:hypothetical protein [Streptomyces albidoflavus]RZD63572.1 hypothetical protein C0Q57_21445 [Streptomyces albidoflavus]